MPLTRDCWDVYDFVHLALWHMDDCIVPESMLQPTFYLLSELAKFDAGYEVRHNGLYSWLVTSAVDKLESLGFAERTRKGICLTEDGVSSAGPKLRSHRRLNRRVRSAVDIWSAYHRGTGG
jgi:uncharacterized protein YwgA